MNKSLVLVSFLRYPIMQKISFYHNVIECMKDNPEFPTPDVPMTAVVKAFDDLFATEQAAADRSRTAISALRDAEEVADQVFRKLAMYVERIADGSETLVLKAGFDISRSNSGYIKPEFKVEKGSVSGSVYLSRRAVSGAKSYIWQYAIGELPASPEGWTYAGFTTRADTEIFSLPLASKTFFRVAAVTPLGTTDFSPALMKIIE